MAITRAKPHEFRDLRIGAQFTGEFTRVAGKAHLQPFRLAVGLGQVFTDPLKRARLQGHGQFLGDLTPQARLVSLAGLPLASRQVSQCTTGGTHA